MVFAFNTRSKATPNLCPRFCRRVSLSRASISLSLVFVVNALDVMCHCRLHQFLCLVVVTEDPQLA